MRSVALILALGLGLLVLAPRPARAADVYGTWQSTSGNVFEITDSRRGGFKLRVTYPNGTQTVLRGDWVPGMVGVQFNYWDANTQYTATFNPRDPDRVRVVYGRGITSWWKRYSHTVAVPAHKAKIFGFWRSTSGNVFEITEARRGGFKLWVTYPTGKRIVLRGDWVRGLSGSQFTYWDAKSMYTGTFTPDDPNRVHVVANGVVNWWQREAGPAEPVAVAPPPPPPPPYVCWHRRDPGCQRTKGGYLAMDRDAYNNFYQLVKSARPHVFQMLERVRSGVATAYLTSWQLADVLKLLKPHVFPMLDAVKACAPRLVDPENGASVVADVFRPHTQVGSQAAAVVAAQRGDAVAVPAPAPAPVALAPPPVPPRQCWDATDPGCLRMRGGLPAANKVGFATVLALVRSGGSDWAKRFERARHATSLIQLTAKQLATLLDLLQPRQDFMLELVRICAPKVVDPENAATVAGMFVDNRKMSREAQRLIRAYPNP